MLKTLMYKIFGKKVIGREYAANGDKGCKVTGYQLRGILRITKVEAD